MRKLNYMLAFDKIINLMLDENFQEGERIPSVANMAEQFKVSKICIEKAVDILKKEDILISIPRSGLYVNNIPHIKKTNLPQLKKIKRKIIFKILDVLPMQLRIWEKVADMFMEQNPYIEIKLVSNEDKGSFVDIMQIPASLLDVYLQKNVLFNIDDIHPEIIDQENFYPGTIECATRKGVVWGIPLLSSPMVVFFKQNSCSKFANLNGLDFWSFMEKLDEFAGKTTTGEPLLANDFNIYTFWALAGLLESCSYTKIASLSHKCIDFLQRFAPYVQNPKLFAKQQGYIIRYFAEEFRRKSSFSPEFIFANYSANYYTNKQIYDIIACPTNTPDGYIPTEVNLNCIHVAALYPEECVSFLSFLSRYEIQRLFARANFCVARKDALETGAHAQRANCQHLISSMNKAKVINSSTETMHTIVATIINIETARWQEKEISLQQAIENIQRKWPLYLQAIEYREKEQNETNNATAEAS